MIQNPILRGFSPDPSIIRVNEDYYVAVSTFEWWPGVKLFHSRDLKHWQQLPSPLRRPEQLNMIGNPTSGGVWAPDISFDGTNYYLVYTDVKTKKGRYYNTHNYMVYTRDIEGEWSEPVYLNSIGFDPSLFHNHNGKKYLVNMINGFKGITVQEMEPETGKLLGERKKVYDGSGIGCTEGPHMYHVGEWYYLLTAEGGTGYEHCVTLARSKSIWGPFETAPENPILMSDSGNEDALQKCGHADIVETQYGEWYLIHLCARPLKGTKCCTLGRETAIQKVVWNEAGWLQTESGTPFALTEVPEPAGIKEYIFQEEIDRDDFDTGRLGVRYVSPRISYEDFAKLDVRPGFLRIIGRESMNSLHHVSLLAVRQQCRQAYSETAMEFTPEYPEQIAGLAYMYDAMNFYILGKTVTEEGECILTVIKSDCGVITDACKAVSIPKSQRVWLRIVTSEDGCMVTFYYKMMSDAEWEQIGGRYSTEIVSDEHCRGFTGAHFGMYAHDMTGAGAYADFDYFTLG